MSTEEQFANNAVKSWKWVLERLNEIVDMVDEEKLDKQIAPGRNRVRYLLGHLVVASDRMFPLLGIGDRLHSELDEAYFESPDRTHPDPVTTEELKAAWHEVHEKLTTAFEKLTVKEWLERHTSVSEEDFQKDASRNRLAILLSRTNHASMHFGQMALAK